MATTEKNATIRTISKAVFRFDIFIIVLPTDKNNLIDKNIISHVGQVIKRNVKNRGKAFTRFALLEFKPL